MRITAENFDIKQIAKSGQCFRIDETGDGSYRIIAFNRFINVRQNGNEIDFSCNEEDWNNIWRSYFDMDTDYCAIGKMIADSRDEYLIAAYKYGSGIRILRQELWETIISFMISQNNNIARIKTIIDRICTMAGIEIADGVYAFPGPNDVDPKMFMDKSLGLGYRSEYLRDMYSFAQDNPKWPESLYSLSYENAMEELMKMYGIGRKVADCICLFGLHHIDAFPIDTHIKKIFARHYPKGFDIKRFPQAAGIVQQYMFYYDL